MRLLVFWHSTVATRHESLVSLKGIFYSDRQKAIEKSVLTFVPPF